MSTINDGGCAFPMQDAQAIHAYAAAAVLHVPAKKRDRLYVAARAQAIGGMTMRDYAAFKAMQGFCANPACLPNLQERFDNMAEDAYRMADAMLKARKEGGAS